MTRHPLHPYAYEAQYRNGRRLRWESPGGPWGEARLPLEGLMRLVVLGHPAGPLAVSVPQSAGLAGLVLRSRGTVTLGPGGTHRRRWLLGWRGSTDHVHGLRLDDQGGVTAYAGPMAGW